MGKAVDFINLMTYDYSVNTNFHPIAPMYWIEVNIEILFKSHIPKKKILLGLNWYGYEYSIEDNRHKTVTRKECVIVFKKIKCNN